MEYKITGKDTYRVDFTTKPEGYQAYLEKTVVDEKSPYRKGIPVHVDVTVEGATDLNTVPDVIMSHAVKDINVAIAATIRPLAGVGSFEKQYDTLKTKLTDPLKYTATTEAASKGVKKSISVLDTLLKAYGVEKLANHLVSISKDIQGGMDPKEIIQKWATIMEKENLEK